MTAPPRPSLLRRFQFHRIGLKSVRAAGEPSEAGEENQSGARGRL